MKTPASSSTACTIGQWPPVAAVTFFVFLLSGLSALLYQVTWQRALMLVYGSNTESVAMVVSSFLVGLGLGNLLGGAISARPGARPFLWFIVAEVIIGFYGVVSLAVIRWAGEITLRAPPLVTGVVVFSLLVLPTLCMGATLPLLVAHQTRSARSVGQAVSWLYFVNTLGAGLGAFVSGFALLGALGLQGTVKTAAILNGISVIVLLAVTKLGKRE